MVMLLLVLILPNTLVITRATQNSYDSKIGKLADQNLKATSSKERSKVSRQYYSLNKQKEKQSGNFVINMIPSKIILILLMGIFAYSIIRIVWYHRPEASQHKA